MENVITVCLFQFFDGIIDSLSLHKTFKTLVNSPFVSYNVCKIIISNGILFLGSVYLYDKVLNPSVVYFQTNIMKSSPEPIVTDTVWLFYHSLWLSPVVMLCYACSSFWYQNIADEIYLSIHGKSAPTDIRNGIKASLNVIYGTVVWLLVFIECKVFLNLTPSSLDSLDQTFRSLSSLPATIGPNLFETPIILLNPGWFSVFMFFIMKHITHGIGYFVMSAMYGWYAFDYYWAANGIEYDKRFGYIENNWPYFVGFGLPYTILMSTTSLFYGYGIYLMLFPLSIILGSTTEMKTVSESSALQRTPAISSAKIPSVKLFKAPQQLAAVLIAELDKQMTSVRHSAAAGGASSGTSSTKNKASSKAKAN